MSPIPPDIIKRIREAFQQGRYTLRVHGFERMIERGIRPQDLRQIVLTGEAIEYDPVGRHGPDAGVLFSGRVASRPLHVKVVEHVLPRGYRHFVVTAYEPDPALWEADFTRRKEP